MRPECPHHRRRRRRVPHAGHLAAYTGVAPVTRRSGARSRASRVPGARTTR
ncbi:MAG: transposase [Pseudonocardia sp.]|uniref:transposase n=1 Tax=unclassified Pseudonocardia TaxID=2619320 RepID=UPI001AD1F45E|nr:MULTISPECIES: transposase [unclassified Pseudonocardia]MBN9108381.1 transposase [Pseudonocardia sp.]